MSPSIPSERLSKAAHRQSWQRWVAGLSSRRCACGSSLVGGGGGTTSGRLLCALASTPANRKRCIWGGGLAPSRATAQRLP